MEKMSIKNEQLIEATKNIPIVAEREGWVLTLDKEEGTLFYSPKKIADHAELHQVTDEYALYLSKSFKPEGVMIEHFRENFLKHHEPLIKSLSEKIFGGQESLVVANPKIGNFQEKGNIAALAKILESTLIKEAGARMIPA